MNKQFIVISREGKNEATITNLHGIFNGTFENPSGVFGEIIEATEAIEQDLKKRGMEPRKALRLTYYLSGCRIGAIHNVAEVDMHYRILKADLTSNRKPIVPNLRVLDYDQRKGVVVAQQFMSEAALAPGGEYFDGRYAVLADGEKGPGKVFDGERLKAL